MKRFAAPALISLLPALALAQELGYTYVEGSVVSSELNDAGPFDADGDGIGLSGSVAVLPRYHLFASYQDEGFDLDLDRTILEIGAGYRYPLQERFELVGRLSYLESDIDRPGPDLGTDGFAVEGGVRGRVAQRVELDIGLRYEDLGSSSTSLFLDGRYLLRPTLAVGGGVRSDDGDLMLRADIRFLFPRD